jgi:hypothetical protein
MTDHDLTYLAVLVCLYSLYEFFLNRAIWRQANLSARNIRARAALLLAILTVGTLGFLSLKLVAGYIVIVVVCALYDWKGRQPIRDVIAKRSLELFLLKQLLVGTLWYALWRYASPVTPYDWYVDAETYVLSGTGKLAVMLRDRFTLFLAITTAYLFIIDGGTMIVRGVMAKFPGLYSRVIENLSSGKSDTTTAKSITTAITNNVTTRTETTTTTTTAATPPASAMSAGAGDTTSNVSDDKKNEENVGEWIGILERIITLTLVLTGNFTAIAFVLTAKSIARFKELEQSKDFAEYYLLGTSGSIMTALGIGILVRIIFGL